MTQKFRADGIEERRAGCKRHWLLQHAIDQSAFAHHAEPLGEAQDWGRLVGGYIGIADEAHNQTIAERAGLPEEFHMAEMILFLAIEERPPRF